MGKGPLKGYRIVEFAGLGAAPLAAMMLADVGADVVRIDRLGPTLMDDWPREFDVSARSRKSIALDMKKPEGLELALRLIDAADGLIEGFRPGVAERLGFGPDTCLARNPKLVYGRMTGWGQEGPLSSHAGHDINYIALSGALAAIGREGQPPTPPLNLVGDGCGGMLMAFGMVCGLLDAQGSGEGQVIDAAMLDAASLVYAPAFAFAAAREKPLARGTGDVDSGAPYYDAYETSDGHYVTVGAMEPQFYRRLTDLIGFDFNALPDRNDKANWPALKALFAERFATRSREEWVEILGEDNTCFAPVLTAQEAISHPHAVARKAYRDVGGVHQPAPAPRFLRSGETEPGKPAFPGADTDEVLAQLGLSDQAIASLREAGVVA